MNHLSFIIAYESGELTCDDELVEGFQAMIDDGTVWRLQGHYGRMADELINVGLCQLPVDQAMNEARKIFG